MLGRKQRHKSTHRVTQKERGPRVSSHRVVMPQLSGVAMCNWHYAESTIVGAIDWKLVWWAVQVGMGAEEFLLTMILTHREDRPDSEFMTHLNRHRAVGGSAKPNNHHLEHMRLAMEMRMELIKSNCLTPSELLLAAAGDPHTWKKWYDHTRHDCHGGCFNQYEHLERMFRPLLAYRDLTVQSR